MDLADAGNIPFTVPQQINIALEILKNTGKFSSSIKTWINRPAEEKTWDNFKTHFNNACAIMKQTGELDTIWADNQPHICLKEFKKIFLHNYSALPTNTQFTERGVKESAFISLCKRNEKSRAIYAMARGKAIPEGLLQGKIQLDQAASSDDDDEDKKKKQLAGKRKTKVLMQSFVNQYYEIKQLQNIMSDDNFKRERARIKMQIASDDNQFKRKRIEGKVSHIKSKINENRAPNALERMQGQTLTPLMQGKIQYSKITKRDNMDIIKDELRVRSVNFLPEDNWKKLIERLKDDEVVRSGDTTDKRFFKPLIDYHRYSIKN